MKTKFFIITVIPFALVMFFTLSHATPKKRYDQGTKTCRKLTMENDLAGYRVFRKFCKKCHNRLTETANFLYSESKTPDAWNRLFFEKYASCAKQGLWQKMGLDDQLKLNDYLFRTGSGSYDPNNADDCG